MTRAPRLHAAWTTVGSGRERDPRGMRRAVASDYPKMGYAD
jgi:hypothetical protein